MNLCEVPVRMRTARSRRSARAALFAAFVLAFPLAAARAQAPAQPEEPELVFSASRYAQEAGVAPASVTIITAREIRQFGYRTLADVLNAVRGFHTRYDLDYDYGAVRGLARQGDFNTRMLVMIDGQRINAPLTDATGLGTESVVDLDQVHHIEVIRGPGSALFGTNAVFGVINVVTSYGRRGAEAVVQGGSYGTARAGLSWGRVRPGREVQLFAGAQRRGGQDWYYPEFDAPSTNNGVAQDLDDEETYRALARGRWGDFALTGAFMRRRRSVPTASYGTTFGRLTETVDQAVFGTVSYTRTFADLSRLVVTAAANRVTYDGLYPYDSLRYTDFQHGTDLSLGAQYLRVLAAGHTVTVGAEGHYVPDGDQGVAEQLPPAAPVATFADERTQAFGAVFAQVEFRLGDLGSLYAGVRRDEYRDLGGSTNPRLSLVLKPREGTVLRALYGTAFRAPNLYELYYQDNGVSQKAPGSLTPERVRSGEVAVDQRIAGLTATLSAYYVETEDLIDLVTDTTDGLLIFANGGAPTSRGIELELRGRVGPVTGRASYAYQRALDDAGARPVDSPRHLARIGAALPLAGDRANLAVAVAYVGERPTIAGAEAPAVTTVALTLLARPFGPRTEFELGVRDLFDAGRLDPAGEEHTQDVLAQDGRALRVGVRQRF